MLPPSHRKSREAEPADGIGRDATLALLSKKQWSYLQRCYELTPRELQVAELVCQGWQNSRIAKSLNIRLHTVKTHIRNIYRKVGVKSKINMLLRFVSEARSLPSDGEHAAFMGRPGTRRA